MFEEIFRDAVPRFAGVTVYDKGRNDSLGRYCIAKTMKLANGRFKTTQTYRHQRPAALRYAQNFLERRASMNGVTYNIGDGRGTLMGFRPSNGSRAVIREEDPIHA